MRKSAPNINQILRDDDAQELERIWPTLPRLARRKEIFAQALRCGGCDKVVLYCAKYADNKIKSEVLMAYALADDAKVCGFLAPLCKKNDVQKSAWQALIKDKHQAFVALYPHCEVAVPSTIVYDVLHAINAKYTKQCQTTSLDAFSVLINCVPRDILEEDLRSSVQMASILRPRSTAGFTAMQDHLDSFYCKQNIQKSIEEPTNIAKRKM